jgi:uncharacterized protein YneF (UPF0154 family)
MAARFITMDKLTLKREVISFLKEEEIIKWREGNVLQLNKGGEWVDAPIDALERTTKFLQNKYEKLAAYNPIIESKEAATPIVETPIIVLDDSEKVAIKNPSGKGEQNFSIFIWRQLMEREMSDIPQENINRILAVLTNSVETSEKEVNQLVKDITNQSQEWGKRISLTLGINIFLSSAKISFKEETKKALVNLANEKVSVVHSNAHKNVENVYSFYFIISQAVKAGIDEELVLKLCKTLILIQKNKDKKLNEEQKKRIRNSIELINKDNWKRMFQRTFSAIFKN